MELPTIAHAPSMQCRLLLWMTLWSHSLTWADKLESLTSQDKFPTYPFYQHVQVRKEIRFDAVPRYEESIPANGIRGTHIGVHASSLQPMMEMLTHSNQEINEARGFTDSAYEDSSTRDSSAPASTALLSGHKNLNPTPPVLHHTLSPSRILDLASTLYDRPAHAYGLYEARRRSGVQCLPFAPKGAEMGIGGKSGAERAKEYMGCLRRKYFGDAPLPGAIFESPSASRRRELTVETMHDFLQALPITNGANFQIK